MTYRSDQSLHWRHHEGANLKDTNARQALSMAVCFTDERALLQLPIAYLEPFWKHLQYGTTRECQRNV